MCKLHRCSLCKYLASLEEGVYLSLVYLLLNIQSYALHNHVSVNNRQHIGQWSLTVIMLLNIFYYLVMV